MATVRLALAYALAVLLAAAATSSAFDSLIDTLSDGKIRPSAVAGLQVAYLAA